jgi:hypothetical protein
MRDYPWPFDNLDRALVRSREMDAPIFLYWGTKWCPPCAEMQTAVLQRPAFRSRCAHMVAVGVDGDALGAQALGDRLYTEVYPTLLLLDGEESEWIRMPGGLGEEAFCAVIDAALRRRTSMAVLADALGGRGRELHDDDLTLLAYHYWPQDQRVHPGAERLPFLEKLYAAAMSRRLDSASRVLIWQLVEGMGLSTEDTDSAGRHRLYDRFVVLLHSKHATYSTLYYLLVSLEPVVAFLCENDGARRRELTGIIGGTLHRLVDDARLTWTERLIAQSASVALQATPESPGGPAPLLERTRMMVAGADAAAVSVTERQSVMNMAGHLLRQSGLREESIHLFRAEIDRSPWPTYFMPYVAEMYMEQNDRDEAFRWWQRSYDETPGKTTRFELGVRYIAALVSHFPQERSGIERLVARLFCDHGDDADMACGRLRKSLGLLARTLGDWQA